MLWLPLYLLTALSAPVDLRDVEFARPAGYPLLLDAFIPPSTGPQPAVILVHGGGWEAGTRNTYIRPWFALLRKAGIAYFTIEYRLAPRYTHPAALEDVIAAVEWVKANGARWNIDPARLALMGESAGGHLVAMAAVQGPKLRTAISFYGIHDIPLWKEQRGGTMPRNIAQYLKGSDPRDASPVTHIKPGAPPMLFIHGTADAGVPIEQSHVMCAALKRVQSPCDVVAIEGAPHGVENWENDPHFEGWKAALLRWLAAYL